jgi:hypothetical protein
MCAAGTTESVQAYNCLGLYTALTHKRTAAGKLAQFEVLLTAGP